jgi:hypothetical protein
MHSPKSQLNPTKAVSVPDRERGERSRTTKRSMQRLPTATAAGAGVASLLVALLLVSVLPGASGGDAGPPLGGRKMGFAGETAGVPARYFNKVALLEIATLYISTFITILFK